MRHTPTQVRDSDALTPAAQSTLARLHARAWGIAIGAICGLGLFAATLFLVIRGGPTVGPHLALLAVFLPFYSVSVVGSVIGMVYGFVIGYAIGRMVGTVYNFFARAS